MVAGTIDSRGTCVATRAWLIVALPLSTSKVESGR